jgi:hypothetical protein
MPLNAETFAVRRLIASTCGLRQAQDTNAAFAAHENAHAGSCDRFAAHFVRPTRRFARAHLVGFTKSAGISLPLFDNCLRICAKVDEQTKLASAKLSMDLSCDFVVAPVGANRARLSKDFDSVFQKCGYPSDRFA